MVTREFFETMDAGIAAWGEHRSDDTRRYRRYIKIVAKLRVAFAAWEAKAGSMNCCRKPNPRLVGVGNWKLSAPCGRAFGSAQAAFRPLFGPHSRQYRKRCVQYFYPETSRVLSFRDSRADGANSNILELCPRCRCPARAAICRSG